MEETPASRPWVTLRPAAATTRSSCCVGLGSASTRTISASRSVSGSTWPSPPSVAASSSSAKKALPAERANSASAISGSGWDPRMPVSCATSSSRENGLQLDALDALEPIQLRQERTQRVLAVQLVRAVGADDGEPLAAGRSQQEGEEVARRAIGPVQVLDDEHQRRLLAEPPEQGQQRLEQPRLGELVVGAAGAAGLGQQPAELRAARPGQLDELLGAELALEVAQRSDDRRVGQLALAQLHAVAGEHARPGGAARSAHSAISRALADTGLAGHQEGRRLALGRAREGLRRSWPAARRGPRRSGSIRAAPRHYPWRGWPAQA